MEESLSAALDAPSHGPRAAGCDSYRPTRVFIGHQGHVSPQAGSLARYLSALSHNLHILCRERLNPDASHAGTGERFGHLQNGYYT